MNLLDAEIIIEMLRERRHEPGAISTTLIEVLRGIEARKRLKVKELLEESFQLPNIENKVIEINCHLYKNSEKKTH